MVRELHRRAHEERYVTLYPQRRVQYRPAHVLRDDGESLAGTFHVLRVNSTLSDMQHHRNTSDSLPGSSSLTLVRTYLSANLASSCADAISSHSQMTRSRAKIWRFRMHVRTTHLLLDAKQR